MPIVGGLDIHRRQITFDYLDTVTGQVCRSQLMNSSSCPAPACQVRPVRAHQRKNNAIEPA